MERLGQRGQRDHKALQGLLAKMAMMVVETEADLVHQVHQDPLDMMAFLAQPEGTVLLEKMDCLGGMAKMGFLGEMDALGGKAHLGRLEKTVNTAAVDL